MRTEATTETTERVTPRGVRAAYSALGMALAAVLIFAGSVVANLVAPAARYDVVAFTEQEVVELADDGTPMAPEVEGIDGPAERVSVGVPIRGQLCVTEIQGVTLTGSLSWEAVSPRGARFPQPEGALSTWATGCHALEFVNHAPPEVVAWVDEHGPTQFVIEGLVATVSPYAGVPTPWRTERFTLVPDDYSGP